MNFFELQTLVITFTASLSPLPPDISPSTIPLLAIPLAVVVAIVVVIVAVVYIRRCRETKLALQFNNTDRGEDRPYSIFMTGRRFGHW